MTIRFLLERAVENSPTRIALKYRHDNQWQTKTYQEFEFGVRQMSEAFHSIGMQANRGCAALIIENSPTWMESYLALTGVGITVVPIDPKLRADEIRYIYRIEVGSIYELVDIAHIDVVGVNVVFAGKSVVADGFFHRRALLERAGADNRVFPI